MTLPPRRSLRLRLFAALSALAVLGVVVYLARNTDPRQARALKTRGAIVAVTHGNDPLIVGASWQKFVLRIAPSLQEWIGGASIVPPATVDPGSLVVWQSLGPLGAWEGSAPQLGATLVDDRGERMRVESWTDGFFLDARYSVLAFEFQTYPRRGKYLRLHTNEWKLDERLFPDLMVANPSPGVYPRWTPDSLPATQRDRNVEVALTSAMTGVWTAELPRQWRGTVMSWFEDYGRLELEVRENGRPVATAWRVDRVEIHDPTGNNWSFPDPPVHPRGRRMTVGLAPIDVLEEPAHRIRVGLTHAVRQTDRRMFEFQVPITRSAPASSR